MATDWSIHWTWFHYFVPSLWGNGPEAIAQTALYGLLAALIVPWTRHWIERHVVNHLKEHFTAESKALHLKMDHIIKHHPDIPPFVPPDAD